MIEKLLILFGTWLLADSIYSIVSYPHEGIDKHFVRIIRLVISAYLIYLGFLYPKSIGFLSI